MMEHQEGNRECMCDSCVQREYYKREQEREGKEIADKVTDYVNRQMMSPDAFVSGMSRQHRTLQQGFTKLCVAWLEHLASLAHDEGKFDLRNEDSVKLAYKLVHGKDWEDNKHLRYI